MESISETTDPAKLLKIAIIGAGVCGLLSARHLKDIANITVYDAKEDIGGCWLYTDLTERNHPNPENDAYFNLYGHFHSSLYHNLYTNIPKECMTFKDFYHDPESTPYIMKSETFHKYLKSYAKHFGLMKYIQLGRTVTSVKVTEDCDHKFLLKHTSTNAEESNEVIEEHFDYVLVCNGHFTVPSIPDIPGKDTFEGTQYHVHSFRRFESSEFDNKNILIVGCWVSANDLIVNLLFDEEIKKQVKPNEWICNE